MFDGLHGLECPNNQYLNGDGVSAWMVDFLWLFVGGKWAKKVNPMSEFNKSTRKEKCQIEETATIRP